MTITTFIGSCLLSALVAGAGGLVLGSKYEQGKAAIALQKAKKEKDDTEERWSLNAQALEEVKDDEIREIHASHLSDLAKLRNRPSARLPQTSSCANSSGATGQQLSGPDADFLRGLAARADEQSAYLRSCQAWIRAVSRPDE